MVPEIRVVAQNDAAVNPRGEYVLYWMTANRRTRWNFALDRALDHAKELKKPLLVFEALRAGYRWASDRLHRFAIQGMRPNRELFESHGVAYFPYVEPRPDADKGLLRALAAKACVVVGDDFPSFFLPHMIAAAAKQIPVSFETVDSNGLFPLRATTRVFTTAFSFRAYLQKRLPEHLTQLPRADPLARLSLPEARIPEDVLDRWPCASERFLDASSEALSELPIDHTVGPAAIDGGEPAAQKALREFIDRKLGSYAEARNDPDSDAASGFSPYLHWGHLSVHQIFSELARRDGWSPEKLGEKTGGKREGWWGMSAESEAFLDELVTWRELGYNLTSHTTDYDRWESLPDWAKRTLREHRRDARPHRYTFEELARARTGDRLWNAAQNQLLREGRMHNYLRMLWGKKVLEWSATPEEALETLIELNNRYALDGRNPNSYSGIFWVFGRYDRPWGPERPVFGTVRYMSSENTARKLHVKNYLARYAPNLDDSARFDR